MEQDPAHETRCLFLDGFESDLYRRVLWARNPKSNSSATAFLLLLCLEDAE